MKKNRFKRWMAILLAGIMALSMVACAPSEKNDSENTGNTGNTGTTEPGNKGDEGTETASKVVFPLEKEVTFEIMVAYDGDIEAAVAAVPFMEELYKMTNVKIKWTALTKDVAVSSLNNLLIAGSAGDAILGRWVSETELINMASAGHIAALDEYISNPELMPNFTERVVNEDAKYLASITTPDGHVYALPNINKLDGNFLENPIWINQEWLKAVNMPVPTTVEELEKVLIAFRDSDCNGNGKTDDVVPLIFMDGHDFSHMEALLSMWGIATKDSAKDHYVDIENGVVEFVPVTETYKTAIKTLNKWYKEGLIWSECFTATKQSFSAKLDDGSGVSTVGVVFTKTPPSTFKDQYVRVKPIAAEGYEAEWLRNAGYLGGKGNFSILSNCENKKILAHWIDLFYSFENTIQLAFGEEGDNWEYNAEGKVIQNSTKLSGDEKTEMLKKVFSRIPGNIPSAYTAKDYAERIQISGNNLTLQENYEDYKNVMSDEFWPRPYMSEENASRLGVLRTDISTTVKMYKANWVAGVSDIDKEWDKYIKSLNAMGLEEYIKILQNSYDVFNEALKNVK